MLEEKAAALLQRFCLGALFRELLSFRNNKIQYVDYTQERERKQKEEEIKPQKAKCPTNTTKVSIKNL